MTVFAAIATAQDRMPDLPTHMGLELANTVMGELFAVIPEIARDRIDIPLVQDQAEYELPLDVAQVEAAYLMGGAQPKRLHDVNVETLNRHRPTWRVDPSGTPADAYLSSAPDSSGLPVPVVGVYPPPASASPGDLALFVSRKGSPLLGTSPIPSTVMGPQVFVEGILYYASLSLHPQRAPAHKALYSEHLLMNREYVRTRHEAIRNPQFENIRGGS
jgi:hypothetical protein